MSVQRTPLRRDFGSACERLWDRWIGSQTHGRASRKPRRLTIDSLEARQLLSVSPVNVNDGLINQTNTLSQYMLSAKSVAVNGSGDFVATWTRNDGVFDAAGDPVTDPATGSAMMDQNVYARYFTNAVQRINLPSINSLPIDPQTGLRSFALEYNGKEVQKLTISAGTAPFLPVGNSSNNITGSFDLTFGASTATVDGYDDLASLADNVAAIQTALDDLASHGETMLVGATVEAIDSHNFLVTFGSATIGHEQSLLAVSNTTLTGLLPFVDVTSVRAAGMTMYIPVSANDPSATAANIQFALLSTQEYHDIAPWSFIQYSPGRPYDAPVSIRTGSPDVTVVARSNTEFDITFTGDLGKQQQPLVRVVNPTTHALIGTTRVIKESSNEFRVNAPERDNPNTIRIDVYNQYDAQVAMDADGDFVITWTGVVPDSVNAGSVTDVFARRFSPAGYVTQWDSTPLASLPASAFVADMNVLDHLGSPDELIQGVRPLGSEFRVNVSTTNAQSLPSVAMDDDGNFTVAWQSQAQPISFLNDIRAQRYDRDGNRLGNEFRVNTVDDATALSSAYVAMSHDGVIAFAWGYIGGIQARVFDALGAELVPQFSVTGDGGLASIDFDAADDFVVTYQRLTDTDNLIGPGDWYDIFAQEYQLYDLTTHALAFQTIREEFRVNSATSNQDPFDEGTADYWPFHQTGGQVVIDADGDLTVSYSGFGPEVSEIDIDQYIRDQLAEARFNGATDGELPAMRVALEKYEGLLRGEANGAMFSQFDADPRFVSFVVLSSDSVANNHRDGQNTRILLDIDSLAVTGDITLGFTNSKGEREEFTITPEFLDDNAGVDPGSPTTGTWAAVIDALDGLPNIGVNWPEEPFLGPIEVQLLPQYGPAYDPAEDPFAGTAWDPIAAPLPIDPTHYVYEITFMGELHDSLVTLVVTDSTLEKPGPPEPEVQTITFTADAGAPTPLRGAVSYTIGDITVGPLPFDSSDLAGVAADLESGLVGSGFEGTTVTVDTESRGTLVVTFDGASAGIDQPDIVCTVEPADVLTDEIQRIIISPNPGASTPFSGPVSFTIGNINLGTYDFDSSNPQLLATWLQTQLNQRLLPAGAVVTVTAEPFATTSPDYVLRVDFGGTSAGIDQPLITHVPVMKTVNTAEVQQVIFTPKTPAPQVGNVNFAIGGHTITTPAFNSANLEPLRASLESQLAFYYPGTKVTVDTTSLPGSYILKIEFLDASAGVNQPTIACTPDAALALQVTVNITEVNGSTTTVPGLDATIRTVELTKGSTETITMAATIEVAEVTSGGEGENIPAAFPLGVVETYGFAGTPQANASIAMTRAGDFIEVWNELALTNQGSASNANFYFREFKESTDTAGPLVTDFLLPTGDRLKPGATVRQELTYLVVTFDEDMLTTGPNNVTNVNNWSLMKDGVLLTGGISKIYYGMNESATRKGAPASNKWEAVIELDGNGSANNITSLLSGHYQIVATTGLRDKAGNVLGRTGYQPNGLRFTRDFDVSLLTGPGTSSGTEERVNSTTPGNQYAAPSDEIQQITFRPTGVLPLIGQFTFSIGSYTSGPIGFDSSNLASTAAAMQIDLDFAGYKGAVVDATINGSAYVLTVRFSGVDTSVDQPAINVPVGSITFPATVSVAEVQKGIAVPPPQATASDANGDYVTVWTSDIAGAAGLYAKVYTANWSSATGTRQANDSASTDILVTAMSGSRTYLGVTYTYSHASYASVACDAAGNFVVTWSEQDLINGQWDWNVWAQRYTVGATISAVGGAFMVNTTTVDVQAYSAVAMDALGGFIVTWQSLNQDGSGWGVYAQRFTSSGQDLGGQNEAQVMTVSGGPTGGTFTLNWNGQITQPITYAPNNPASTASAMQAQLRNIGASGVLVTAIPATTQFAIEFAGALGDRDQPLVTVNSTQLVGGTAARITIETSVDGSTGEFRVNDTTANNQMFATIAMNGSGAFVIGWTGYGQDGDLAYESNVYAKTYQSSQSLDLASHRTTTPQYKIQQPNPLSSANLIVSTDNINGHVVPTGTGRDGVVRIDAQGLLGAWMGSGALLLDGRHILTAAHVVYDDIAGAPVTSATVSFDLPSGRVTMVSTEITVHPDYDPFGIGVNDIAIITLPQFAPAAADRYDIYRTQDELGQVYDVCGYGATGQGLTGDIGPAGTKHNGANEFELLGEALNGMALTVFGFPFTDVINIPAGSMLLSDFDDGTAAHDALGQLLATVDLGLGAIEVSSAHGDSGGPVFINGKIAGIVDIGLDPTVSDVNATPSDASFGSISGDVRVSYYASWIDGVLGGPVGSPEFRVNETITADQKWSSVAIDGTGNFVVTWTSFGQDGTGNGPGAGVDGLNGIYVRRYDADGTAASGEFKANTYTADDQQYSRVAMNTGGDFTVVWESYQDRAAFNGAGSNPDDAAISFGVFGQRYVRNSLVGVPVYPGGPVLTGPNGEFEAEFEANSTKDGDQRYPSIAMDDNGDFMVVWSGNGTRPEHTDTQGVFRQRFDKPTDTAGPRVISTYNNVTPLQRVLENGILAPTVSSFLVTFSEDLSQVGGPGGAHSITNLNNWSLTRNGATISNAVASVTYVVDPLTNRYQASIIFDVNPVTAGNQPLGAGTYVLTINGAVQDKLGVNLDGNLDGTPGDSFRRTFVIQSGGEGGGGDVTPPPGPGTPPTGSTDNPISGLSFGDNPAIASDGVGNSVVVWSEFGLIVAQRLDSLGMPTGLQTVVNTTAFSLQTDPDVAMDSHGNFVVVWSGSDLNGYTSVYGRMFNAAGVASGDQFQISPTMTTIQQQPSVARSANGGFVVTWSRYNQVGNKNGNIIGRSFDAFGNATGGEFTISTTQTRSNEFSDVAIADNGNVVVTWQSLSTTNASWDIYAQRLNFAGGKLGGEFLVNNVTTDMQLSPRVSSDAAGNYVIVWQSYMQDGSEYGAFARRYSASGAAANAFRVNETVLNRQYQPDVAMARNGSFTVVWTAFGQDDLITKDYGIYARMFAADSSSEVGEFRINAETRGDQVTPVVSRNANNGSYTVAWAGFGNIYARAIGAAGGTNTSVQSAGTTASATIGLYNPASSTFYLRNTATSGNADTAFNYGPAGGGWITIAGDWDGDGKDTIGLYNPATSVFYLRNSNDAGNANVAFAYGPAGGGWKPIVGDWDGDGKDTIGLYNATTGTYYLRNSNTSGYADLAFRYGAAGAGWMPLAGDWNGDGKDTIGAYNPAGGVFYLRNSNDAGYADVSAAYGTANAGWKPLVGDWDNDGTDTIGVYNPTASAFQLKNSNTSGGSDTQFLYGPAGGGWAPLVGSWTGAPALMASSQVTAAAGTKALTQADLRPIVAEALARWKDAGLDAATLQKLSQVQFVISDLPEAYLGQARANRILLDRDAAGHGWFVDATPAADEEFARSGSKAGQAIDARAVDRIDLLTVVAHELGHLAGLDDLDALSNNVMEGVLGAGVRRSAIDAVLARA